MKTAENRLISLQKDTLSQDNVLLILVSKLIFISLWEFHKFVSFWIKGDPVCVCVIDKSEIKLFPMIEIDSWRSSNKGYDSFCYQS